MPKNMRIGVDLYPIDTMLSESAKQIREKELLRKIAEKITKVPETVRRYT